MPEVSPVVETPVAMPETTPVVQTEPVIYGGANPVVDVTFNPQPATHQIYGGADPLENTQTIPQVGQQPVELVTEPVMISPVAPVSPVVPTAPVETAPVVSFDQIQQ